MRVAFRPEALAEMEEAARWYDQRRAGLGDQFLAAVAATLAAACRHPHRWPEVMPDVHRALVARFPYAAFYAIEGKAIVVLRCRHTARRPFDE